jgi:hypothetical protein
MTVAANSLKNLDRSGRRWGAKNHIPITLKEAIINAAIAHGSDGAGTGGLQG